MLTEISLKSREAEMRVLTQKGVAQLAVEHQRAKLLC